jgi:hypothetical protein
MKGKIAEACNRGIYALKANMVFYSKINSYRKSREKNEATGKN